MPRRAVELLSVSIQITGQPVFSLRCPTLEMKAPENAVKVLVG